MHRWIAALAVGAVVLGLGARAVADENQLAAREIHRAGEAAFARGDYRAAALAFEEANRQVPNGGALFNAGVSWQKAREPARAADAFAGALAMGDLDRSRTKEGTQRLRGLEKKLGILTVEAPPGTQFSIAHVRDASGSRRIHLLPSDHLLVARGPDGRERRHAVTIAAATESTLDLSPPADAPVEQSAPMPVPSPYVESAAVEPVPASSAASDRGTWGWVLVGAGTVAVATGAVLWSQGLAARNEFDDGGRKDEALRDRAVTLRTWSAITIAGGAVLGGVGAVMLLTAPSSRETGVRFRASLSASGASLALDGL